VIHKTNPQQGRNRSHATWLWYIVAALFLLFACGGITAALTGCATGDTRTDQPASVAPPAPEPAATPNAVTRALCDAVVDAYLHDKLADPAVRSDLTFRATRLIGVDGRVASAVTNTLYAGGTVPTTLDDTEHRYRQVLKACRDIGYQR
jgi:hypothetical protein